MKKVAVVSLVIGTLLAVVDLILCVTLSNWNLLFYGSVFIGVVFIFASAMTLWSSAGIGGGGIFTRRRFQEMYRDNPHVIITQQQISNRAAVVCLCIAIPNIVIPIITEVIRHGA